MDVDCLYFMFAGVKCFVFLVLLITFANYYDNLQGIVLQSKSQCSLLFITIIIKYHPLFVKIGHGFAPQKLSTACNNNILLYIYI